MPEPSLTTLASDIAAALDWWREAGVDTAFSDDPRTWLAAPEADAKTSEPAVRDVTPRAPPPPPPRQIGGDRSIWPADLASFKQWWLSEQSLDEGGLAPRVAPSGEPGAELMVLVPMPADQQGELLAGPAGKLLDAFLAAAGLSSNQVYRAAVLPRHTSLADWADLKAQGMGALLAHHVALARPKRLLVLGQSVLPLCGHDPAQATQKLRSFNHESGKVPALTDVGLDRLLANWQLRARFWKRWLDWTDGQSWDEPHG